MWRRFYDFYCFDVALLLAARRSQRVYKLHAVCYVFQTQARLPVCAVLFYSSHLYRCTQVSCVSSCQREADHLLSLFDVWQLSCSLLVLLSRSGHLPPGHISPDIFTGRFPLPDNFPALLTARRVCIARTMPWEDVRLSVRHTPVFCLNGYT